MTVSLAKSPTAADIAAAAQQMRACPDCREAREYGYERCDPCTDLERAVAAELTATAERAHPDWHQEKAS